MVSNVFYFPFHIWDVILPRFRLVGYPPVSAVKPKRSTAICDRGLLGLPHRASQSALRLGVNLVKPRLGPLHSFFGCRWIGPQLVHLDISVFAIFIGAPTVWLELDLHGWYWFSTAVSPFLSLILVLHWPTVNFAQGWAPFVSLTGSFLIFALQLRFGYNSGVSSLTLFHWLSCDLFVRQLRPVEILH